MEPWPQSTRRLRSFNRKRPRSTSNDISYDTANSRLGIDGKRILRERPRSNENLPTNPLQEKLSGNISQKHQKNNVKIGELAPKKKGSNKKIEPRVLEEVSKNTDTKKIQNIRDSINTQLSNIIEKSSSSPKNPTGGRSIFKSHSFSSPLTQERSSPFNDRFYIHQRPLIHDKSTCRPVYDFEDESSPSNVFKDTMKKNVTKLYNLIIDNYAPDERENFTVSDAYVLLENILQKKTTLVNALKKFEDKATEKESYKNNDSKMIMDEFERIYKSAMKNRQLHNESLLKEEELESKLFSAQIRYKRMKDDQ